MYQWEQEVFWLNFAEQLFGLVFVYTMNKSWLLNYLAVSLQQLCSGCCQLVVARFFRYLTKKERKLGDWVGPCWGGSAGSPEWRVGMIRKVESVGLAVIPASSSPLCRGRRCLARTSPKQKLVNSISVGAQTAHQYSVNSRELQQSPTCSLQLSSVWIRMVPPHNTLLHSSGRLNES